MKFVPVPLAGAFLIELEQRGDERGFFPRVFCERELAVAGLDTRLVQINNSLSKDKGAQRGLHYQLGEAAEVKVVRCVRGALWDAILDLRPGSGSFGQSFGAKLIAKNRRMMHVPRGFAHGFLTLEEDTEPLCLVPAFYAPERERGVRWNDPRFAISWPAEPRVISDKDAQQRDFDPAWHLAGWAATMRIPFIGASPFTGNWFVRELVAAGHQVTAAFRGDGSYKGLRGERVRMVGRHVVTGSVFKANEGAGSAPLRGFSPYGLSKGLTATAAEYYADRQGFTFEKFVIPSPFGPHEEPRIATYLMNTRPPGKPPACRHRAVFATTSL